MHLLQKKKFMEKYLCRFAQREPYPLYETILERMIGSTFNSSNMHEVVDDNSNSYKNMVMDAIRMNQDDLSECSIVDE